MNEGPINCNGEINLKYKNIKLLFFFLSNIYLSIPLSLFNNNVVPPLKVDIKMEIIVSISTDRMCESNPFIVIQNHGYSVSDAATIVCPFVPFKGDNV